MRAGAEPWAVGRAPIGMRRLARLVSSVRALPVPGAPRLGALPRRGVGADSSRRFAVPATVVDAHPAEDLPSGVRSPFAPAGDQPAAIDKCVRLLRDEGRRVACLRGATGTGKTFVVANVLDRYARDRPTLVVVPNKTLAAQVARELRGYLPSHRVELFVSHFSLYVPESFSGGRYVEKRSAVDPNLDALRHRATKALVETDAVVVVASVSCLYGLGMPADYVDARLVLDPSRGFPGGRDEVARHLIDALLYSKSAEGARRVAPGEFAWADDRPRDAPARRLVLWPPYEDAPLEIELDREGVLLERGRGTSNADADADADRPRRSERLTIWPRQHHVTPPDRVREATAAIRREMVARAAELRAEGSHIEAERLEQRTTADVGLLEELGWCPGAEHYSRHLAGRAPGDPPVTLLDYLNFDARRRNLDSKGREGGAHREGGDANRHRRGWLLVADESHVMLPQLRAMHGGDRSRKRNLVAGGYRLPSALDNRPLTFDEFWERVPQALLVSATPGEMETAWCAAESEATGDPPDHAMVDMVVRPSGVLDPTVTVLPREGQLPALAGAIRERAARGEASLVCALTKADCEDLAGYLNHVGGIRADWLHSELPAPRRAEKLQRLQRGEIDCVVGAQLLREGLDLPQVSLVAVLDAGVPGFMRSSRSLMQMMGRAARNASGECILFADAPYTRAMLEATEEVARRRRKQEAHNAKHGIVPTNASQGSPSATLSLFEVMAEEIAAERDSAAATAAARAEANPNVSAISGVSGRDRFTPTEEEVQTALRAWRLEREGVADARAAAEAAAAAARDAADALSDDVGEVWGSLGRRFSERSSTDALFAKPRARRADDDALDAHAPRGYDDDTLDASAAPSAPSAPSPPSSRDSAERALSSEGLAHEHVGDLRRAVADLPAKTGVYRWLAADGSVLYVGKAKNLRARARGYLAPGLLRASPRHLRLAARARFVDAVLTPGGEADALALEARLIRRFKPPMNVLLKHAPKPQAAMIVATLGDDVPRFFAVDAADASDAGERSRGNAIGAGGNGAGGNAIGLDGAGGRVRPGVVAATSIAAATSITSSPTTRTWLRADRRDARRALTNLERALRLRSLGFRARHGDEVAARQLRVAANTAAAALDGGDAAEAVIAAAERDGDYAAAAALAAAAAPADDAVGALSALVAEAAAANAAGNDGVRVDVVAAAAEGEHCVVQVIRVRDGTVAGVSVADARLPRGGFREGAEEAEGAEGATFSRLGSAEDESVTSFASASSGSASASSAPASASSASASSPHHAAELETALGEATQAALEAYYSLAAEGGEGAADVPDGVVTPHELPDPGSLERLIRSAARRSGDRKRVEVVEMADGEESEECGEESEEVRTRSGVRGITGRPPNPSRRRARVFPPRALAHGADLPAGLPTALASLALSNARESARKSAAAAAAAESLAATLRLPGDPDSGRARRLARIEGVDVSHLAGGSTAASVVAFRDGRAEPNLHRRYELDEVKDGVAPGDDPAGIRAAVLRRCAAARRARAGKHAPRSGSESDDDRPDDALPDLILVDGGVAQLLAAARALRDAGVVVSNADGEERPRETPRERLGSANRVGPRLATSLAAIAKGRASGEEIVYVPRAVTDANANGHTGRSEGAEGAEGFEDVDFAAEAVFVGPGASRVRGGGANVAGGGATALLRAVRDESHAVALGAQRRRRRRSMFREMLAGQGGLGADDPDLERSRRSVAAEA